jgi:hypothetical protein
LSQFVLSFLVVLILSLPKFSTILRAAQCPRQPNGGGDKGTVGGCAPNASFRLVDAPKDGKRPKSISVSTGASVRMPGGVGFAWDSLKYFHGGCFRH